MSRLLRDGNYEDVFKLYEAVNKLLNIKAYLASERRQVYNKGIHKHCLELDEYLYNMREPVARVI